MLRLAATTQKLQAVLGGAVSTNQLHCVVCYSDDNGSTYVGGSQYTSTNDTTAVDICAAPASSTVRDIDYLSIRNRDTAAAMVTVMVDVSGTDSEVVKATLAVGDQLVYTHSNGWTTLDSAGQVKSSASGGTSYTDEEAQDAVGTILTDSATIDFTYTDATPAITATVINQPCTPGGRLTLSSATPVMTSDVSNSTSIYYTPYIHDKVPIYDGANWTMTTFTELTNTTTDSTKNPAAVGADSNYDLFVWNDSGTIRLGRGPAWTSATARGTGAGTTELERVNGIWMNKIAITNGPAAQRGTYVGTVRSDGSSTIDWELGGSAVGGNPIILFVWNMYNRVSVCAECCDSTDSWTYGTGAWRSTNNSTSNRVSFVVGVNEDGVSAQNSYRCQTSVSGDTAYLGIGLDVTNANTGLSAAGPGTAGATTSAAALYSGLIGLGYHFLQGVEYNNNGAANVTYYGDNGGTLVRGGLLVQARA